MELPTPTQLAILRGLLSEQLKILRAAVRAAERAHRETQRALAIAASDEPADAPPRGLAGPALHRAVDEMEQVEAALQRLELGIYGGCLECGEPIALQRLLADPAAERCAACEDAIEGAIRDAVSATAQRRLAVVA